MKIYTFIKLARVVLILSFIVVLYFLLPYIFPVIGIDSFVITSNSMKHSDQSFFETFWKNMSIEPENIPFRYGLESGDLLIVGPSENYNTGDVVLIKLTEKSNIAHRIYKHNSTHFRDIGDRCMTEENLKIVSLAVDDVLVVVWDPEEVFIEPDKIYEGPYFESCTHYWMPVRYIHGKALFAIPQAGLLHMWLQGPEWDPELTE